MIGERTRTTHELPAQDRWASIRAAWAQIKIDLAYQDNMFPELEVEFGRSRTLTVSVSLVF